MPVHPHVRGAHSGPPAGCGPSGFIHVRGAHLREPARCLRSIPTCVGLTRAVVMLFDLPYRSITCGAHTGGEAHRSIHVRGLTPLRLNTAPHPVHPRAWGSRSTCRCTTPCPLGPSPRAWGSPSDALLLSPGVQVHPHVRGARPYRGCIRTMTVHPHAHSVGLTHTTCVGTGCTGGTSVHPHVRGAHRS